MEKKDVTEKGCKAPGRRGGGRGRRGNKKKKEIRKSILKMMKG